MDSEVASVERCLSSEMASSDAIEITDVSVDTEGLYHCEKCCKNFQDSNIFSSHACLALFSTCSEDLMSAPSTEKIKSGNYKCPVCGQVFSMPSALKKHFRIHQDEPKGPFHCSESDCQFSHPDRMAYQKHLQSEHSLPLTPCTAHSCRWAFRTPGEMEQHRRSHVPFHCTRCDFVTAHAKQLSDHRLLHERLTTAPESEEVDNREEMVVRPTGTGLCKYIQSAPRRRGRAKTRTSLSVNNKSEEEEEEQLQEQQPQNKKRARGNQRKNKSATTNPKDHTSKGHIVEGTEHLYRTHICSECRRCFKTRSHLLEHMHLHFPDPSLQCPTCKHHFTSKSKLHIHLLRESGQKQHHCHLCDYGAVERNSLRRHLASVHGDQAGGNLSDAYPCPSCGKSFRQSQALKAHMKSHHTARDGQPLVCFHGGCSFQCTEKRDLQRHTVDTHGVKAVECRHHACGEFFESREAMEAHYRTHQAFHCTQCNFSCSNKSRFQQHKRRGHPGEEELSCGFCPFTTFNPVEFEQHLGHFHANEKIHRCHQCNFVTAHKRVLGRHMLMHTGEKPHKCKLCDFRCRDETYLSKHMLTHSDDKNHMCSECGYVTKWKHYLNVHMRKHAGDLRYQCNQCSYRCHRTDQLNSHKLRHQAKSLICEVCAYSCKRKSELRKHMQLKHSSGEEYQPPIFQCKYCTYQTRYRQALHNHENCKHTRTREFRCALCPYTTFSNTGLFLHKRKVHGYVPGDVEWLENYAEKERENSSVDLLHNFYSKPAASQEEGRSSAEDHIGNQEDHENSARDSCLELIVSQNFVAGDMTLTAPVVQGVVCEQVPLNASEKQVNSEVVLHEVAGKNISESHQSVDDEEQCCTLVLTPITNTECSQAMFIHDETENGGSTALARHIVDPNGLHTVRERPQILTDSINEEDVSMAECEEQSDTEEQTGLNSTNQRPVQGTQTNQAHQVTSLPEPSAEAESETLLKAMRKHDKDQVDALVLEGRVQMLVVQTQARVYQCEHCSYVTRKQASLIQHGRSSCRVKRAALSCKDCGAEFQQQRGLDTHRLKKCPVLLRKTRRFHRLPTAGTSRPDASTQARSTPEHSEGTTVTNSQSEPSSLCHKTTGVTVDRQSEPTGEESIASPSTISTATGDNLNEQKRQAVGERTKMALKTKTIPTRKENAPSVMVNSGTSESDDTQSYTEEGGKFTCKICAFSSCRMSTIERHCTTCTRNTPKRKSAQQAGALEPEDDTSDVDYDQEEEEGDDSEEGAVAAKVTKPGRWLSCPSCPFVCRQKRALASHEKRGCLKPNEIQCQFCSFVAKSQEALNRHALVHKKGKPSPSTRGKKPRLQCELCPFTCKLERCMTQHVALKHEGARPHRCRFCAFSTTRRYRLEAHESLHTGVGRHQCELCSQTFGTTSKLRLHRQRVHDKQPTHFCSLCDYSGYSLNDIGRHTLSCHTGELCHPCSQCEASFNSDTALKQHHNRKHQTPNILPCAQCDYTCSSQATLKVHQQRQHPQLECATCQMGFDTPEGLEKHRKTHLTKRCPACPFAARTRYLLAQHLLDEHEEGSTEEKPLSCALCGFSCSYQLVFEQHIRSHGGTRLYKCTDCQYSTRNRQKITWHIRIHTGEKPYRCEKCSYSCADPSRLKYHMRIHQEERKYLCPECGYKCKWVSQLKYHMTKHTGAKPYACEECEYRTNRADALRVHRETRHRDVRSFVCEKCGKAFKTRFLLKTHQKKHSEERAYVCRVCHRSFRWPAGLRHHYLTHTNQLPFHCLHCPYRAKQRFQVVKHLRRHHPDQPVEQGVGKDPGAQSTSLQKARLGAAEETPGAQEQQETAGTEPRER